MTSASELFHSRRYRFSLRHTAVDDVTESDSSLAADHHSNSSYSHQHRTTTIHRRHNRRHDLDGCDHASRRIHRRRLDLSEHEAVHPEQGRSQSPSGSIINSDDFRSIHRRRATESDRLPGSVLLARERLVERLRGVSVSGIRQSNGSSSSTHQDDFSSNNMSEIRSERMEEMASESGLTQDALKSLQLEDFSNENDDEVSSASRECTICLEGFRDGDNLVRLNCTHRFHSCCLFPWVRVCGACPNCRKPILVNVPMK